MEKEKKETKQSNPNKSFDRWYENPTVIVLFLILLLPVGLVLLGNSKNTNIAWKISISLLVFAMFIYVGSQYKLVRQFAVEIPNVSIDQLEYSDVVISSENSAFTMTGKKIDVSDSEIFLKVSYTISNKEAEEIYYISMLDEPCLEDINGERIMPDLSISNEPFGLILPNESKTGFLFFRFSKSFIPENFLVRDFLYNIYEQN
jgi:hypothetical protein